VGATRQHEHPSEHDMSGGVDGGTTNLPDEALARNPATHDPLSTWSCGYGTQCLRGTALEAELFLTMIARHGGKREGKRAHQACMRTQRNTCTHALVKRSRTPPSCWDICHAMRGWCVYHTFEKSQQWTAGLFDWHAITNSGCAPPVPPMSHATTARPGPKHISHWWN